MWRYTMAKSVIFIVGRCNNEAEYKGLMGYIDGFYRKHIPAGNSFAVTRWDADVLSYVNKSVPVDNDLIIIGFSFGGCKAVEVCAGLKRPVQQLILLDPVSYVWWGPEATPKVNGQFLPKPWTGPWVGNTWDFVLPDNVMNATCFYRQAKEMPWSACIRAAKCKFTNKLYVPKSKNVNEGHGEYVWSSETINLMKTAIATTYPKQVDVITTLGTAQKALEDLANASQNPEFVSAVKEAMNALNKASTVL
jgi:hypothetical protein